MNIYQYIDFIKILEAEVFIDYERREHSSSSEFHSKRRPIDVQRDAKIQILKSNLINSLNQTPPDLNQRLPFIKLYIRAIAHLYQYEESKKDLHEEKIPLETFNVPQVQNPQRIHLFTPLQNLNSPHITPFPLKTMNSLLDKFNNKSRFGINLLLSGLNTLKPNQWLNDNMINYFLNLLLVHLNRPCLLFNTFFFNSIKNSISSVDSWFQNVNIFSYKFHLIPIHHNNNHWMLVCTDLNQSKVTLFDSFHQTHPSVLLKIKEFYQRHYVHHYSVSLPDSWTFIHEKSIPLQRNGYDCGVFVCKFAELFLREPVSYNFLSRDCDFFRKQIMLSLLTDEIV